MPATAEIYKWTDERGRVYYSDKAPDVRAKSLDIDAGSSTNNMPPDEAKRRENTRRLLRAFEEERRIKQKQEQQQQTEEAERKKRCVQAHDRLQRYRHAGALYELDDQGNRRILDDEQRRQAEVQAAQAVTKWCN